MDTARLARDQKAAAEAAAAAQSLIVAEVSNTKDGVTGDDKTLEAGDGGCESGGASADPRVSSESSSREEQLEGLSLIHI